ncbi:hypothetical protein ABK040_015226 [Willaertia magna]
MKKRKTRTAPKQFDNNNTSNNKDNNELKKKQKFNIFTIYIPNEILAIIFQYISQIKTFQKLSLVNKNFYNLIYSTEFNCWKFIKFNLDIAIKYNSLLQNLTEFPNLQSLTVADYGIDEIVKDLNLNTLQHFKLKEVNGYATYGYCEYVNIFDLIKICYLNFKNLKSLIIEPNVYFLKFDEMLKYLMKFNNLQNFECSIILTKNFKRIYLNNYLNNLQKFKKINLFLKCNTMAFAKVVKNLFNNCKVKHIYFTETTYYKKIDKILNILFNDKEKEKKRLERINKDFSEIEIDEDVEEADEEEDSEDDSDGSGNEIIGESE